MWGNLKWNVWIVGNEVNKGQVQQPMLNKYEYFQQNFSAAAMEKGPQCG